MAIKIVGVACSPRAGQSTHGALSACLDVIRQEFKAERTDACLSTENG